MRADVTLWHVPVIILSNKMLSMEDVKPIEGHTRVTLQSKGIWSENETVAALNRALFGTDGLPAHTGAACQAGNCLPASELHPSRFTLGNRGSC